MAREEPSVVIIGAGIAGVAAAECLQKSGITSFIILEASTRIGGRIQTKWFGEGENSYKVEMGANWIHGVHGNPVFQLAKKHKLLAAVRPRKARNNQLPSRCRTIGLMENGSTVPDNVIREVFGEFYQALTEADHYVDEGKQKDISMRTFIINSSDESMSQYEGEDLETRRLILEHRMTWETTISGCHDMNQVSHHQFGTYEELSGPNPIFPDGYESLIDFLTKDIPQENILLGQVVKSIIWNQPERKHFGECKDDRNTAGQKSQKGLSCLVECEKGQQFQADYVIFTGSLGYLKENATHLFHPSLPSNKLKAIEMLGIGTVDKIFLEFDNLDFMPDQVNTLQFFWDKVKRKNQSITESWTTKICHAYIEGTPDKNMMTFWITGKEAEYMETLSDDEVKQALVQVLEHFLKRDVPMPNTITRSYWYSNPYTRGSYSFPAMGSTQEHIRELARPLSAENPLVCFAGEATHEKFYSTTHGALLSGQREAQRILNSIQMLNCD